MSRTYTTSRYIAHFFKSKRWDSFHSPFLFSLMTHCCNERNVHQSFGAIEKKRKELINTEEVIERQDYGAGSVSVPKNRSEPISSIARQALSLPFQCRFLYRLADFLKPGSIVEFGTSLGISTAYLAICAGDTSVDTIEGDPEIAKTACKVFESLALQNIRLHNSTFEHFISGGSLGIAKIDLVFLDGHHTGEALMRYYQALKEHIHSKTIIVVDDIYWSADMTRAWEKLRTLPEVTQSVDCFHFGLLLFNPDFLHQENHVIRLPFRMLLS